MILTPLALPGVVVIEPQVYRDARGEFLETWNEERFAESGIEARFVQDNLSVSRRHTLRGLHYQIQQAQGKLVRVMRGAIFDVIVDLRRASAAFGKMMTVGLEAGEHRSLWVPPGLAHGFLALADDTWVQYKVTEYWAPRWERTLRWDDPALAIPWPLPRGTSPLMSEKDRAGVPLADAETYE